MTTHQIPHTDLPLKSLSTQTSFLFNCALISTKDNHSEYYQTMAKTICQQFPVNFIQINQASDSTPHLTIDKKLCSMDSAAFPHIYQYINVQLPYHLTSNLDHALEQVIISKIPTYIIWSDPADQDMDLFFLSSSIADKVFIDSTDLNDSKKFFKSVTGSSTTTPFLDFNWCRIAEWRKAFGYAFCCKNSKAILDNLEHIHVQINGCEHSNHHQLRYLLHWMAQLLNFSVKSNSQSSYLLNDSIYVNVKTAHTNYCRIDTDYILNVELVAKDGSNIHLSKDINSQSIKIHTTYKTQCLLPFSVSVSEYSLDKFIHELLLSPNHQVYLDCLKTIYP